MSGKLTTHILDTAHGQPADGVTIELWRENQKLKETVTNADGRTDEPLMEGDAMEAGTYQLVFHIGDYFKARGTAPVAPPFLDKVPVQFGIADATAHYHVPLLASPWSYSTYRGS